MITSRPPGAGILSAVDLALLIARVAAGLVMFPHGTQHLFGWFGGTGLVPASSAAYPGPMPSCVHWRGLRSLALILGVLSRFSAASLVVIMLGAIFIGHMHGVLHELVWDQAG